MLCTSWDNAVTENSNKFCYYLPFPVSVHSIKQDTCQLFAQRVGLNLHIFFPRDVSFLLKVHPTKCFPAQSFHLNNVMVCMYI